MQFTTSLLQLHCATEQLEIRERNFSWMTIKTVDLRARLPPPISRPAKDFERRELYLFLPCVVFAKQLMRVDDRFVVARPGR